MALTHYWYRKEKLDVKEFKAFSEDVDKVLKTSCIPLSHFSGNSEKNGFEVNENIINFNGKGKNSHETFYIEREIKEKVNIKDEGRVFEFCKTAGKPYDMCVTAALILAKVHLGSDIKVTSDGKEGDWQAGKELASKVLKGKLDIEFDDENNGKGLIVYYEEAKVKVPPEDPAIKERERRLMKEADPLIEEIIG